MALILRPVNIDDLALLCRWDEEPHIIASDPNDDWGWAQELQRTPHWREQLIAEVDGRPIGFLQIIDPALEDSHYWGDIATNMRAIDIWIGEAAEIGKGYGTKMMQKAVTRCFADGDVSAILVDPLASNVRAHRFYQRLGFRFVNQRLFGADLCHVHSLSRVDWYNGNLSKCSDDQ